MFSYDGTPRKLKPAWVRSRRKFWIWFIVSALVLWFVVATLVLPYYRFQQAESKGKYVEATRTFSDLQGNPLFFVSQWLLESQLDDLFAQVEKAYLAGKFTSAQFKQVSGQLLKVKSMKKQVEQRLNAVENIQKSRGLMRTAKNLEAEKQYVLAYKNYSQVLMFREDPTNVAEAKRKLAELKNLMFPYYRSKATALAAGGDFVQAYKLLVQLKPVYSTDKQQSAQLASDLLDYQNKYTSNLLELIDSAASSEQYKQALDYVNEGLNLFPENNDRLAAKKTELEALQRQLEEDRQSRDNGDNGEATPDN